MKLSEKEKLVIFSLEEISFQWITMLRQRVGTNKKETSEGVEYWMARELMALLDYAKWANFCGVIEKAKIASGAAGMKATNHIADVGNMVLIGSGAQRERGDCHLTRYRLLPDRNECRRRQA